MERMNLAATNNFAGWQAQAWVDIQEPAKPAQPYRLSSASGPAGRLQAQPGRDASESRWFEPGSMKFLPLQGHPEWATDAISDPPSRPGYAKRRG